MNPTEMLELYEYNAWADRRVLGAARALSKERFSQPICSSFPSVRDTLGHICGVDWLWLERFQRRSPSAIPDARQYEEIAGLEGQWAAF